MPEPGHTAWPGYAGESEGMRDTKSWITLAAASLVIATSVRGTAPPSPSEGFHAQSVQAMDAMMKGMDVESTGDVDRDFVAMMVPHHQGAIDMAVAELRYGKDEHLRRIAQEIIVDQQQEIAAMRLALGQPLPPSTPAPTSARPAQPFATKESP